MHFEIILCRKEFSACIPVKGFACVFLIWICDYSISKEIRNDSQYEPCNAMKN